MSRCIILQYCIDCVFAVGDALKFFSPETGGRGSEGRRLRSAFDVVGTLPSGGNLV